MEITYKNKKLKKKLTDDTEMIKSFGKIAKKVKQRITQLKSADNLDVISKIPPLRLHPYKGNRQGTWSIDIQENWRICFETNEEPIPKLKDGSVDLKNILNIKIISVEDPH